MPHYDFKKDIQVAKKTEVEVAEFLKQKYGAKILEIRNDNRYDIRCVIGGKEITIEVKEDFICERTGNVGLEYECRGKPSGINTTQADYYLYKIHAKNGLEYVLIKTDILRRKIEQKRYFLVVNGGDKGSNSMNYLFKHTEFLKDGHILKFVRKDP